MNNWKKIRLELLSDKSIKKEYDSLEARYQLISQIIKARLKKGISQNELAKKIGTKQSAISRLESGNSNPSLDFLIKISNAIDTPLVLQSK